MTLQERYFIWQEYKALSGNDKSVKQDMKNQLIAKNVALSSGHITSQFLGNKFSCGRGFIESCVEFGKGIDRLATVDPKLKEQILSGKKVVPNLDVISELRKLRGKSLKAAVEELKNGKVTKAKTTELKFKKVEHKTREITAADAANSIMGTLHQFELTLDRLIDDYQDFIKKEPQRYETILERTINNFIKIKEELGHGEVQRR